MDAKQTRQGVLLALAAYFIWGYCTGVLQVYRLCTGRRDPHSPRHLVLFLYDCANESSAVSGPASKTLLKTPKKVFLLALSAVLIGGNWLLFIWAVNNHHMLEASLGYFINPLVNIVLGCFSSANVSAVCSGWRCFWPSAACWYSSGRSARCRLLPSAWLSACVLRSGT